MTNAIVTTGGAAALTPEQIALMQGDSHTSDFNARDLTVPYIRIVQSTSGYMKRNDSDYIADAKEGDILDTLTLTLRQRAAFIPSKYEQTFAEWKPNMGPLVRQWGTDRSAYDAAAPQTEGFEAGTHVTAEGNLIVPAATYYGLLLDESGTSMPVILAFTGTQAKKSRKMATLVSSLQMSGANGESFTAPMWSRIYQLNTVPESNEKGSWSGWGINPGPLTLTVPGGAGLFAKAKKLREDVEAGLLKPAAQAERTPSSAAASGGVDPDSIPF